MKHNRTKTVTNFPIRYTKRHMICHRDTHRCFSKTFFLALGHFPLIFSDPLQENKNGFPRFRSKQNIGPGFHFPWQTTRLDVAMAIIEFDGPGTWMNNFGYRVLLFATGALLKSCWNSLAIIQDVSEVWPEMIDIGMRF